MALSGCETPPPDGRVHIAPHRYNAHASRYLQGGRVDIVIDSHFAPNAGAQAQKVMFECMPIWKPVTELGPRPEILDCGLGDENSGAPAPVVPAGSKP